MPEFGKKYSLGSADWENRQKGGGAFGTAVGVAAAAEVMSLTNEPGNWSSARRKTIREDRIILPPERKVTPNGRGSVGERT